MNLFTEFLNTLWEFICPNLSIEDYIPVFWCDTIGKFGTFSFRWLCWLFPICFVGLLIFIVAYFIHQIVWREK